MADERDRKDDPIVNQKRVLDATIARSERDEDAPMRMVQFGIVMPYVIGKHGQSRSVSRTK